MHRSAVHAAVVVARRSRRQRHHARTGAIEVADGGQRGSEAVLVVERPGALDELTVLCEPAASVDTEGLRQRIHYALREATGLSMVIQLQAPNTVPRSEGKAVRVIDKRTY